MIISDYVSIISNVGFPIFTAIYMMTKLNFTIKENTKLLIEIKEKIKN